VKKILGYLKQYYREEFRVGELVVALLFITGFCFFKYYKYIPSEWGTLSLLTSWWYNAYFADCKYVFHLALYGLPLLFGYVISSYFHQDWSFWTKAKFWVLICFGVAVFSTRSVISEYVGEWLVPFATYAHIDWLRSVLSTILRGSFLFIAVWVYWYFNDRKNQPFYGFTLQNYDVKPYLVMLAIMLPLIMAASFLPDFLESYPRVNELSSLDFANSSHFKHFAIYEFLYGLDFFSIEFFFRGFMILAFVGIVGPRAIIPMAYIYVVIHWNKPMGELISSFFGGSLLGIVAYYSRSIVGGILVHVGIAWMMEVGAFISKYFFP
jgi:hypothetical protein